VILRPAQRLNALAGSRFSELDATLLPSMAFSIKGRLANIASSKTRERRFDRAALLQTSGNPAG
jgi:hypothetical protein